MTTAESHLLSVMDGELGEDELALVCGTSVEELRETLERLAMLGVVTFEPLPDEGAEEGEDKELEVQLSEDALPLIDALYDALERTDYYTLLGLSRDADKNDVKKAYYRMAPAFHPDKHYGKYLGPYKNKIEAIFTQLTRAHDTLRYKRRREAYDESFGIVDSSDESKVRLPSSIPSGGLSADAATTAILQAMQTLSPPASTEGVLSSSAPPVSSSSPSTLRPGQAPPAASSRPVMSQPRASSKGAASTLRSADSEPADSEPPDSDPQITKPSFQVAAAIESQKDKPPRRPSQVRRRILTPSAGMMQIRDEPETQTPPPEPVPSETPSRKSIVRPSKPGFAAQGRAPRSQPSAPSPRSSRPVRSSPRSGGAARSVNRAPLHSTQPRSTLPSQSSSPAFPAVDSPPTTGRPQVRRALSPEQMRRRREALRRRLGVPERKKAPPASVEEYPPLPQEVPRSSAEVLRNNFEDAARHARRKRFTRYLNAGRRAMEQEDYRAAAAAFEQALKLDPDHEEAKKLAEKAGGLVDR